jgi:sensor histidine kinase regulating citrate/malate metabolism
MVARKAKDLYSQRKFWRLLLMCCASIIILFSLVFTYHLARTIEKDEKNRVQNMAKAYQILVSSSDQYEINGALKLTRENETIPVIWTSFEN